tara:strand:+ start:64 stop:1209 length:1146 start_codon:yes stop_codon:yes gene_type:complete
MTYINEAGPYLERIVTYNNTSGTYSDGAEYLSDSTSETDVSGEDALIYYVRGWNTGTSTGYCSIYDDNGTQHLNVGDGSTKGHRYTFNPATEITDPAGIETAYFDHTAHKLQTGQYVKYNNGGGTNISGLSSGTEYYVIRKNANQYRLASSHANALALSSINVTDGPNEDGHYFVFTNAEYRIFQAACGPDYVDATPDVSQQTASFEWMFPHPIAARNGFLIGASAGVIIEVGYRTIGKRTPYGTVIGEAPSAAQTVAYNISNEICLKNRRVSGTSEFDVTDGPAEVWGLHIMNNNTSTDKQTQIEDGDGSTIATFRISKSIETTAGDVVLNASRYGPINFPLPLICKTKLRYGSASNTQSSILYREINKEDTAFPSTYSD